jgi:hypothetical protein
MVSSLLSLLLLLWIREGGREGGGMEGWEGLECVLVVVIKAGCGGAGHGAKQRRGTASMVLLLRGREGGKEGGKEGRVMGARTGSGCTGPW